MAARLIRANIPVYESGYVHMPLEFINEELGNKQKAFDTTAAEYENVIAKPHGLETVQDELGNIYDVPDYQKAVDWASKFNSGVDQTADEFYKTGDVNSGARGLLKLKKELELAQSQEGILGRNKARQEAYTKLHEGLAKVKNLPNSYWRSIPYLTELDKIQNDPSYIPATDVAYADYVDRIDSTNKIMSNIADELFDDPYAFTNGKYIYEGKRYGVTPEKVQKTFEAGLSGNTELKTDIDNQIQYEYFRNKPNEDFDKFYERRFKEESKKLLDVALKNVKDMGDKSMKGDPYGQAGYEYELNNPSLPIISEHGATGVTKGSSFDDWKKALGNKNSELDVAKNNTASQGFKLIQAAGITDKSTVDYIVRHRNEFYNSDGSLNLQAVQQVAGKQLNPQDITNLQSGFAFYNEAYKQEKDLERQRDNMQVRVDNLNMNFANQYNKADIDKEFEANKDIYSGFGINSSAQLLEYIANNPENAAGGFVYDDQGKAHNIQGLANVGRKTVTDLNEYYENNGFADSYLTLENASPTRGVGIYNKGITDHFKKDPVALLNSRVDGTTMTVKDFLKKNKINPEQINIDNLSTSMVGNSMLDGGTGLMVSIKDGKGKKLAEIPISDDGIQWGARDQILNQSYYDLMVNPSTSNPSNQQYSSALELSKGNLVAGKELRQIDTKNMQPNEQNTIRTNTGVPYTITKLPMGGYTVTAYGSGGKSYSSNPSQPLTDDNAILQFIGNIEFSKNTLQLQK